MVYLLYITQKFNPRKLGNTNKNKKRIKYE